MKVNPMKKSLIALGLGLLLSTSALAEEWYYVETPYAPAYGAYQQPVVRPVAAPQQQAPQQRAYQQQGYQQQTYQQQGYQQQGYQRQAPQQRGYQQQAYQQQAYQQRGYQQQRKQANKNDSKYRIGNPLYHPAPNQTVATGETGFYYTPKVSQIGQEKATGWTLSGIAEMGLTKALSAFINAGYGQYKIKVPDYKNIKRHVYNTELGLRYLLASADGFDLNVLAGLYYEKGRIQNHRVEGRATGTDIGFQVGKKIQNITPYFGVGFTTDFWSKRGSASGTDTYINPGVYIDLSNYLSLNLGYTSVIHGDAVYRAILDAYVSNNVMVSFGGLLVHPETDKDTYGVTAGVKVAF